MLIVYELLQVCISSKPKSDFDQHRGTLCVISGILPIFEK